MDWVIGIVTGVISGIVASIVLSLILCFIKPKIKLSDYICREVDGADIIYKIKVVNKSRVMLTNVHYSLIYHKDQGHGVSDITKIPPRKADLEFIDKYKNKKDYADYAVRLTFNYDEDKYPLSSTNFLEFVLFAEHSLSNRGKCFKQSYYDVNIDHGQFETGSSTKII